MKPNIYTIPVDVNVSDTYRTDNWDGQWSSHDMATLNAVINKMREATFTYDKESNHFVINYKHPQYKENLDKLGFDINAKGSVMKDQKLEKQIINNNDLGKLLYIEKKIGKGNEAIRTTLKNAIAQPNTPISVPISVKPVPASTSQAPAKTSPSPTPASASASAPLMSASASLEILRAKASEQRQVAAAAAAATAQPRTAEQEKAYQQKIELRETANTTAALLIKARQQKDALKNAIPLSEEEKQKRVEKAIADAKARAARAKAKPDPSTSATSPEPPAAVLPKGWTMESEDGSAYYVHMSSPTKRFIKPPPGPPPTDPQLPPGWRKEIDSKSGIPYYGNENTSNTQWEFPVQMVSLDWRTEVDPETKFPYYVNINTGLAQWDFPGVKKKYYKY
jgi:hypothetical protein